MILGAYKINGRKRKPVSPDGMHRGVIYERYQAETNAYYRYVKLHDHLWMRFNGEHSNPILYYITPADKSSADDEFRSGTYIETDDSLTLDFGHHI